MSDYTNKMLYNAVNAGIQTAWQMGYHGKSWEDSVAMTGLYSGMTYTISDMGGFLGTALYQKQYANEIQTRKEYEEQQRKAQEQARANGGLPADPLAGAEMGLFGMFESAFGSLKRLGERIGNMFSGRGWNTNAERAGVSEEKYAALTTMKDRLEAMAKGDGLGVEGERALLQVKIAMGEGLNEADMEKLAKIQGMDSEAEAIKNDFRNDSKETTNARMMALAQQGYDVRGLYADVASMRNDLEKDSTRARLMAMDPTGMSVEDARYTVNRNMSPTRISGINDGGHGYYPDYGLKFMANADRYDAFMNPDRDIFSDGDRYVMDAIGAIPAPGAIIADLMSAGMSWEKDDYFGAALGIVGVVPIYGDAAKFIGRGARELVQRYGDDVVQALADAGKPLAQNADEILAGLKNGDIVNGIAIKDVEKLRKLYDQGRAAIFENGSLGFNSFEDLKKVVGEASPGSVWHHIVEQSQAQMSRMNFPDVLVQNTENIIELAHGKGSIHQQITNFYGTNFMNTGVKFRDLLTRTRAGFAEQYDKGLEILNKYRIKK